MEDVAYLNCIVTQLRRLLFRPSLHNFRPSRFSCCNLEFPLVALILYSNSILFHLLNRVLRADFMRKIQEDAALSRSSLRSLRSFDEYIRMLVQPFERRICSGHFRRNLPQVQVEYSPNGGILIL